MAAKHTVKPHTVMLQLSFRFEALRSPWRFHCVCFFGDIKSFQRLSDVKSNCPIEHCDMSPTVLPILSVQQEIPPLKRRLKCQILFSCRLSFKIRVHFSISWPVHMCSLHIIHQVFVLLYKRLRGKLWWQLAGGWVKNPGITAVDGLLIIFVFHHK